MEENLTYHGLSKTQVGRLLAKDQAGEINSYKDIGEYTKNESNQKYLFDTLNSARFYSSTEKDNMAEEILKNKYLAPGEKGPLYLWHRQAEAIASVEKNERKNQSYLEFMSILDDFEFVPGGRIMHGAGRDDIKNTLNNCYVVKIEKDSIKAIYQAVVDEAETYKYGGGCGHDLSVLRPSGDKIGTTGGESCGPVGFMELFSTNTNTIAQHGRRGANMQTMRVDHPDIIKFIQSKSKDIKDIQYSNISVLLTNPFMEAVEKDGDFDLKWGGKVYETIKARKLWNAMTLAAHENAEPGLIFWDTMLEYHNAEYCSPLISTNPCAEQPLPKNGCCNLGSHNLEKLVLEDGTFNTKKFEENVSIGTRFLDNVIEYNLDRHALEGQKENAINDRRIGQGILGLGNMLIRMGIKYDTKEGIQKTEEVLTVLRDSAYKSSIVLGQEKGKFPNYNWEGFKQSKFIKNLPKDIRKQIEEYGIRNSTITTVAPTGSGAIVARVTSGIEPMFGTTYKRRVKDTKSDDPKAYKEYTVKENIIKEMFGDDKNLPEYVVTAHKIDPFFRLEMQAAIQKYIDSSISSTINLPRDAPIKTVADIYFKAWKKGLKGITVYREGAREGILLTSKSLEDKVDWLTAKRPKVKGITVKVPTPYDDSAYITVNNIKGTKRRYECFIEIGKAGKDIKANSEGLARAISAALKGGASLRYLRKQFKGIGGETTKGLGKNKVRSLADAVGNGFTQILEEEGVDLSDDEKDEGKMSGNLCIDCGLPLIHQESCEKCTCGYSKC